MEYFGAYLQNYSRAVVLGLGDSVTAYKPDNSFRIGVNDIEKYHKVNHLIVIDQSSAFENKRLSTIVKSTPEIFLSHIGYWDFMSMFHKIELSKVRGSISDIEEKNVYPYSIMSPYVAIVHAYKLGFKEIVIYGVDLNNHKSLSRDDKKMRILKDIRTLNFYLKSRNVNLYVYNKSSALSNELQYISNE